VLNAAERLPRKRWLATRAHNKNYSMRGNTLATKKAAKKAAKKAPAKKSAKKATKKAAKKK